MCGHTHCAIRVRGSSIAVVWAGLAAASACAQPEVDLGGGIPSVYREVVNTPATLRNKVDLLFVVDNTDDMGARQAQLAHHFGTMLDNLAFGRGLPDLHIGFVSTDMGAGEYSDELDRCTQEGDSGRLLSPTDRGCGTSEAPYLAYAERDAENIDKNFSGELENTFACMTQLGESGCDYEQPLEAMRTSLREASNLAQDFVRDDAILGVVLVTNEDDCSAFNPDLFDPNAPTFGDDSPNFRCFHTGVICDGDDVYQPGTRDGCRPHPESGYITPVVDYVEFLADLKGNRSDVVVAAIIGDPGNVVVGRSGQGMAPELLDVCADEGAPTAFPGIRLNAFADAFQSTGLTSSICNAEAAGGLNQMARNLRKTLGTTCLEGNIADVDADEPGRQVDCRVFERDADENITRRFTKCDNPGHLESSSVVPCYAIQTGGEVCGDFETQLALQIHGPRTPPAGTHLVAECRVDVEP